MDNGENIKKQDIQILMVGLDGAGKTSLLYKLKLGEDTENIPTIGYNVETVEFEDFNYKIWDMGGLMEIRSLWEEYKENISAVIFVVDAANPERFEEAKQYLHTVMNSEDLENTFLLVVANKQDKLESSSEKPDLEESLDLKTLKQFWRICNTTAVGNFNLYAILQNLTEMIKTLEQKIQTQIKNPEMDNSNEPDTTEDTSKADFSILMLGLENAGKTTLLYQLSHDTTTKVIPTIGFNVEIVEFENKKYSIWDIGGSMKVRFLWTFYLENRSAVIFVVDAANPKLFEEAKQALHAVMASDDLSNAVLLIVANKQDKLEDTTSDISDFEECLDMKSLKQLWRLCKSCAIGSYNIDVIRNLSELIKTKLNS